MHKRQGPRVSFGTGWHYVVALPKLMLSMKASPGSHSIASDTLNSVAALTQSGRSGIPIDATVVAWCVVNGVGLHFLSQGGVPRMRLDDPLAIEFAASTSTTENPAPFPQRKDFV